MRNKAKCRLCSTIIESHFAGDVVSCKCGEIAVYDGPAMRMECNNIENFLRIDDLGNEIQVSYKEKGAESDQDKDSYKPSEGLTKAELIQELHNMTKDLLDKPIHYMTSVDLAFFIVRVIDILKRE